MRNFHSLTLLAAVAVLAAVGCKSQQGSTPNPFMSAERVQPPATRTPAPGTATPYYPNDPLPVMPTGTAAAAASAAPPAAQFAQTTAPIEGAIGLPTDNQPERIVFTPGPPPAGPTSEMASSAAIPPPEIVASAQPTASQPPPISSPEFTPPPEPATLSWNEGAAPRPVIITPASASVTPASFNAPTTPRVRLPGYAAPPTGTVQITELPPISPTANAAPPEGTTYGDGFQPRGTTVQRPLSPQAPEV